MLGPYLVGLFWEVIRKCSLVGGVPLRVGFGVLKAHARKSLPLSPFSLCSVVHISIWKLSATVPVLSRLPATMFPDMRIIKDSLSETPIRVEMHLRCGPIECEAEARDG